MKFKLENHPSGVLIGKFNEPFTQENCDDLVKVVEKMLAVGKARIILSFALSSASGELGIDFIEKILRRHRLLAKKMGGDIRYVLPITLSSHVATSESSIDHALRKFGGFEDDSESQLLHLKAEMNKLREANTLLAKRLVETLKKLRSPQTDEELQRAMVHYKALAVEAETK